MTTPNDAEPVTVAGVPSKLRRSSACLTVFARRPSMVHGVAGDEQLVFVSEPLERRVVALDRRSGELVATLPSPEGGYGLPFTLRVPETGKLVVLDSGGVPAPDRQVTAWVVDVSYRYDGDRGFEASISRVVSFEGLPIGFAEDVEVLNDGSYVVSEAAFGALWLIERDGSVVPAIVPDAPGPEHAIYLLAPGPFPGVQIGDVWFSGTGGFAPGVGALAARGEHLYFGTTSRGGVHRIPIAALRGPGSSGERARTMETVSACPSGQIETLKGLCFDRFDPNDHHLYVTDPFRSEVTRIDTNTGKREVLCHEPDLLDFPVCAQFLPSGEQPSWMVMAVDQEHRFRMINDALEADAPRPPFSLLRLTR